MNSSPLKLFQAFGMELEFVIVDRTSLKIAPLADELLHKLADAYVADFENGPVTLSNEMVCHLIELKNTVPQSLTRELEGEFQSNVKILNKLLLGRNLMLLPAAAHPFMDPKKETRLWPHEYREIYARYHQLFDSRNHGWSNVASVHLNLPFSGDEEFSILHSAVRLILPLVPGICAASPVLDGKYTGYRDSRLVAYKENQKRVPSITGAVIPEAVFCEKDYEERIFLPIVRDMESLDPENILDKYFLNSRGAIARFDRGSIEIRLMDVQESCGQNMAVAALIVEAVRALTQERWSSRKAQQSWSHTSLVPLLEGMIREGEEYLIDSIPYLELFGLKNPLKAGALWSVLYEQLGGSLPSRWRQGIEVILEKGTLGRRIETFLGPAFDRGGLKTLCRALALCLADNRPFL